MLRGVIRDALLPARPDHATPGPREDADGVRMLVSTVACALVDAASPRIGVTGGIGKCVERLAQVLVAGPAEGDSAMLARLARDGHSPAFGGEVVTGDETGAV